MTPGLDVEATGLPTNPELIEALGAVARQENTDTREKLYAALGNASLVLPTRKLTAGDEQIQFLGASTLDGQPVLLAFTDRETMTAWNSDVAFCVALPAATVFMQAIERNCAAVALNLGEVAARPILRAEMEALLRGEMPSPEAARVKDPGIASEALYPVLPLDATPEVRATAAAQLRQRGNQARRDGRLPNARACYERALALERQLGNHSAAAWLLNDLGGLNLLMGVQAVARHQYAEARQIFANLDDSDGQAMTLSNLGWVDLAQGERAAAVDRATEALSFGRTDAARRTGANLLINVGLAYLSLQETAPARRYLEQAADLARDLGDEALAATADAGLRGIGAFES